MINKIQKDLFSLADENYKIFHSRLIPDIKFEDIIGVRTPILRKYAKELSLNPEHIVFLNSTHKYYDEKNLHAFLIETYKDFDTAVDLTEKFLPQIDNWATCDMFFPKVFNKNKEKLLEKILVWLKSNNTYTVRYAIVLLLKLYLDDDFKPFMPELVASIKSDEYYINMAISWYFATALSKQYDNTIAYIEKQKLSDFCHDKTISKACESFCVPKQIKDYLKTFKTKRK